MKKSKNSESKSSISIILVIALIFAVVVGGFFTYKNFFSNRLGNEFISNVEAEKQKDKRYLTIINETEQIINEVHVYFGDGEEADTMKREEPEQKSFSIQIPEELSNYDEFKVTLIDRYGYKYEKSIDDVSETGRTNVKISEKNKVKQKGDFFRKIEQFFNND
jgi:flagellar basal body-associated protein FliL